MFRIDFEDYRVHHRKSNTEPILGIDTEAATEKEANELAERFKGRMEAHDIKESVCLIKLI